MSKLLLLSSLLFLQGVVHDGCLALVPPMPAPPTIVTSSVATMGGGREMQKSSGEIIRPSSADTTSDGLQKFLQEEKSKFDDAGNNNNNNNNRAAVNRGKRADIAEAAQIQFAISSINANQIAMDANRIATYAALVPVGILFVGLWTMNDMRSKDKEDRAEELAKERRENSIVTLQMAPSLAPQQKLFLGKLQFEVKVDGKEIDLGGAVGHNNTQTLENTIQLYKDTKDGEGRQSALGIYLSGEIASKQKQLNQMKARTAKNERQKT